MVSDPQGPGFLRSWDGWQWTEHSRPVRPVRSRIKRATATAVGLVLLLLAGQWVAIGVQERWDNGSFALVAYFVAACLAVGAAVCLWVRQARRQASERCFRT